MDSTTEPVWQKLRRREELRKAETATGGGRMRYVSPLELFRQKLDAEAGIDSVSTTSDGGEDVSKRVHEGRRSSSVDSSDADLGEVFGPPSPDDFEVTSRHARNASHCYSGSHECDLEQMTSQQPNVLGRESWLRSLFRFKQPRKAMRSKAKTAGQPADISTTKKDAFFRNPLHNKNKREATTKTSSSVQVEESPVSHSYKDKGIYGRVTPSTEKSEGSRTLWSSPAPLHSNGNERIRKTRHQPVDEELSPGRHDDDTSADDSNYALLIEIYKRPTQFPFGRPGNETLSGGEKERPPKTLRRCRSETRSPRAKRKSYSAIGALRKALVRSKYCQDDLRTKSSSLSPDPPSRFPRRSSRSVSQYRQRSRELGGDGVTATVTPPPSVSQIATRARRSSKRTGSPTATSRGESPRGHFTHGRARQIATEVEKSRSTAAGSRSTRCAEDTSDQGYTAFVPFQGFAAFSATPGAYGRADQHALTPSLESQGSSLDGSQNSSNSKSGGMKSRRK